MKEPNGAVKEGYRIFGKKKYKRAQVIDFITDNDERLNENNAYFIHEIAA